jgi:hypothetical protein
LFSGDLYFCETFYAYEALTLPVQEFATRAGFGQAKEIAGDGNFMKVLAFQKDH